jgi:hypothetical protein
MSNGINVATTCYALFLDRDASRPGFHDETMKGCEYRRTRGAWYWNLGTVICPHGIRMVIGTPTML